MPSRRMHRLQAIVLDHTHLAEQDLIITMLVQSGARLQAVAKGARKPGSRLAARSELASEIDILVAEGKSLSIISDCATVNAHQKLRNDFDKTTAACAILDVARCEDPYLYAICSRALTACEEAEQRSALDVVVAAYVFKVMAHEGWMPACDACVFCGEEAISCFSAEAGGSVCESCSHDLPHIFHIDSQGARWIESLIMMTFSDILELDVDAQWSAFLVELAKHWAEVHLDTRIKALEFFEHTVI